MLLIDYGVGNLRNVQKLFDFLGQEVTISNSVKDVDAASSYILPGVGAYQDAMSNLHDLNLVTAIQKNVIDKKKPILGICLGMQVLGKTSEENGYCEGLGLLDMTVKRIEAGKLRLPHIGWNDITITKKSVLLNGLPENPDFYFVHTYHGDCQDPSDIAAVCQYGEVVTAAVERGNIFGAQFHPEKSQAYGAKIIKNYIDYCRSRNSL